MIGNDLENLNCYKENFIFQITCELRAKLNIIHYHSLFRLLNFVFPRKILTLPLIIQFKYRKKNPSIIITFSL